MPAPARPHVFAASTLLLVAATIATPPAPAQPPAHAPAHGWRKKNDPDYQGYSGRKWKSDYGIIQGQCNREAVGAVVGGAIGGAIGSQVGGGDGRTIATIVGTVVGAAIGAKIGRDMDAADRACVAHSIELARPNTRVVWTNGASDVGYALTPLRDFRQDGRACRDYELALTRSGRTETQRGTACRSGEGSWQIVR